MDLARFAIEKRSISLISTLLILVAGYFAYAASRRFEDPEFIIRQTQIITPYPGASAEEVASEVTEVIEDALQQLQGIDEVRSVSSPGVSIVTVEFTIQSTPDYPDIYERFAQMRAKNDDAQSNLPPNALATRSLTTSVMSMRCISLLFSRLIAIWLTPCFCTVLMKEGQSEEKPENGLLPGYRSMLQRAIAARVKTVAVVVALFGSAIAMFGQMPAGFSRPQRANSL